MSDPIVKKPSKKTFHFPKNADNQAQAPESNAKPAAEPTTKPTTKPTAKPTAKPAARKAAKPANRPMDQSAAEAKARRTKKEKVVRDSFTMPKSDYDKIAALKLRCLAAGAPVKKSEILRAGLLLLDAASPKRLMAAIAAVEQVKTGRPSKS